MTVRSARSVVYVAGSMSSYGTAKRTKAIAQIADLADSQSLDVFLPERRYRTHAAWVRGWSKLCRSNALAGVVIVPDGGGAIGAGVMREVSDAIAFGVPVFVWTAQGLIEDFSMHTLARPTAMRAARITVNKRKSVAS